MCNGAVTGTSLRRLYLEMQSWWKWLPTGIHAAGNGVLLFFMRCAEPPFI